MPWVYDPHSGGVKIRLSNPAQFLSRAESYARTRQWYSDYQLKLRLLKGAVYQSLAYAVGLVLGGGEHFYFGVTLSDRSFAMICSSGYNGYLTNILGFHRIMQKNRPVNLNLFTIRLPVPALVSIFHRISGLIIFISLPLFLFMAQQSLASEKTFQALKQCLSGPGMTAVVWLVLCAFVYHLLAGVRHVLMDFGVGISRAGGRATAWMVLVLFGVFALMVGWYCVK